MDAFKKQLCSLDKISILLIKLIQSVVSFLKIWETDQLEGWINLLFNSIEPTGKMTQNKNRTLFP